MEAPVFSFLVPIVEFISRNHLELVFTALVLIAFVVVLVDMRNVTEQAILTQCSKFGINYTDSQYWNGEVNYTNCNITATIEDVTV